MDLFEAVHQEIKQWSHWFVNLYEMFAEWERISLNKTVRSKWFSVLENRFHTFGASKQKFTLSLLILIWLRALRGVKSIPKWLCLFVDLIPLFTKLTLVAFQETLNTVAIEISNYESKISFFSTKLLFQVERWMKEKAIDADKINLENEQQAKLVFQNKTKVHNF